LPASVLARTATNVLQDSFSGVVLLETDSAYCIMAVQAAWMLDGMHSELMKAELDVGLRGLPTVLARVIVLLGSRVHESAGSSFRCIKAGAHV
jgi:hypothetical protein